MSDLAAIASSLLPVPAQELWVLASISVIFALFGRLVRGVTTGGAVAGAAICFALLWGAGVVGFAGLVSVFLLTWIATRIGYSRKQRLGMAEPGTGRNALQVFANLGTAAGCAVVFAVYWPDRRFIIAMVAALAEAAADTVSSEIGQARGYAPRLVTTWKRVAPGTNGAITQAGTLAGSIAAVIVASALFFQSGIRWQLFVIAAAAAIAGMIFDSFLGATLERRHFLGNNRVNFISTVIAAAIAYRLS